MPTTSLAALLAALVPLAPLAAQDSSQKARSSAEQPAQTWETKTKKLRDGVVMTADYYAVPAPAADAGKGIATIDAPVARWGVAVCMHQGGASRGEYRGIAPTLNELGLDVLAVDLRAGGNKFMVENETAKAHLAATKTPASASECYDDVVLALKWARELSPGGPLIVFGCAPSAALAIMAATREKDVIDALVLFSPGEYVMGVSIWEEAAKVTVPIYATCGAGSKESSWMRNTLQKVPPENVTMFLPGRGTDGLHGAVTLLAGDKDNQAQQWAGVKELLEHVKPKEQEE